MAEMVDDPWTPRKLDPNEPPPLYGPLGPGVWAPPAQLFSAYRRLGLSPEVARGKVLESLQHPQGGSHHGWSREELDEFLRSQPQS